jgi:hypothetical protein
VLLRLGSLRDALELARRHLDDVQEVLHVVVDIEGPGFALEGVEAILQLGHQVVVADQRLQLLGYSEEGLAQIPIDVAAHEVVAQRLAGEHHSGDAEAAVSARLVELVEVSQRPIGVGGVHTHERHADVGEREVVHRLGGDLVHVPDRGDLRLATQGVVDDVDLLQQVAIRDVGSAVLVGLAEVSTKLRAEAAKVVDLAEERVGVRLLRFSPRRDLPAPSSRRFGTPTAGR